MIIADVGAITIARLMAGTGVVRCDPSGSLKPGSQNVGGLDQKSAFAFDQKPHHLALGYGHTQ